MIFKKSWWRVGINDVGTSSAIHENNSDAPEQEEILLDHTAISMCMDYDTMNSVSILNKYEPCSESSANDDRGNHSDSRCT